MEQEISTGMQPAEGPAPEVKVDMVGLAAAVATEEQGGDPALGTSNSGTIFVQQVLLTEERVREIVREESSASVHLTEDQVREIVADETSVYPTKEQVKEIVKAELAAAKPLPKTIKRRPFGLPSK